MAIDVGAPAIGRASYWDIEFYQALAIANPVNANGTVNTVEIQLFTSTPVCDFWVGTFYNTTGTNYTCRGSESIGSVAAGDKQTFTGLIIDAQTNDLIGGKDKDASGSTQIECDTAGGSGLYYYKGEAIDPNDSATYTTYANADMSLYGTGTEAVGGLSIPVAMHHYNQMRGN